MVRRNWFFLLALAYLGVADARHHMPLIPESENLPWFTGPLFAPASHVTPPGMVNFEPYYIFTVNYGNYDQNWKVVKSANYFTNQFQGYLSTGIVDWLDIATAPSFAVNTCQGVSSFEVNDLPLGLDFQLYSATEDNYWPSVKVGFREVFPVGKCNHLSKSKKATDVGGEGSYQTQLLAVIGRAYHLRGDVYLNAKIALACDFFSRVHLKGRNLYGGGPDTNGYAYPGFKYGFDAAAELCVTKNWVVVGEFIGSYTNSRKFKGNPGTDDSGNPAVLTGGSTVTYQLLPAVEYNWNANLGLITGADFTVAGRNSMAFASWQTAININF